MFQPSSQSVISQIRQAAQPGNRLAALLGALIGALPPVGSYMVVHHALDRQAALAEQPLAYLVAGLMVFSGLSVVRWTKAAFRSTWKAIGWTVGVEGLLVGAPDSMAWLAGLCVGYLVVINAISAASGFVADYAAEQAELKADRAQSRAAKRQAKARVGAAKQPKSVKRPATKRPVKAAKRPAIRAVG